MHVTLDGAPEEWSFQFFDDEAERHTLDELRAADPLLLGRVTYEAFVEYWPTATDVVSGGGGSGLCSHLRGVCAEGQGHPEDRGALFHAVEIAITEAGDQAFEPVDGNARLSFGGRADGRSH